MIAAPQAAGLGALALRAAYWTFMSPQSQILGDYPYQGAGHERAVALSFDDGPNEPYTTQLADFLADQQIRATFFQVGSCVEKFPDTSRRLIADGHEIGNHSYSHQFHRCWIDSTMQTEINRTQQILSDTTGIIPTLYRPPWLLRTRPLFRSLAERGLQPISGEFCHPLEPFQPAAALIARRVLSTVRPGKIIIFHDGFDARGGNRANTVEAVKIVVGSLRDSGYAFATVSELLAADVTAPSKSQMR